MEWWNLKGWNWPFSANAKYLVEEENGNPKTVILLLFHSILFILFLKEVREIEDELINIWLNFLFICIFLLYGIFLNNFFT